MTREEEALRYADEQLAAIEQGVIKRKVLSNYGREMSPEMIADFRNRFELVCDSEIGKYVMSLK